MSDFGSIVAGLVVVLWLVGILDDVTLLGSSTVVVAALGLLVLLRIAQGRFVALMEIPTISAGATMSVQFGARRAEATSAPESGASPGASRLTDVARIHIEQPAAQDVGTVSVCDTDGDDVGATADGPRQLLDDGLGHRGSDQCAS